MAKKPRFEHECAECTFLGHYDVEGEPPMDLYAHWEVGKISRQLVTARWGDRVDIDCASGINRVKEVPALREAINRAVDQGVMPPEVLDRPDVKE